MCFITVLLIIERIFTLLQPTTVQWGGWFLQLYFVGTAGSWTHLLVTDKATIARAGKCGVSSRLFRNQKSCHHKLSLLIQRTEVADKNMQPVVHPCAAARNKFLSVLRCLRSYFTGACSRHAGGIFTTSVPVKSLYSALPISKQILFYSAMNSLSNFRYWKESKSPG